MSLSSSRRSPLPVLVAFSALAALTACSTDTPAKSPKPITEITTAWPSDITTLDPANMSTGQDRAVARNIYQTLLSPKFAEQSDGSLKFQGAKVVPYLAESWDTGASWITFRLRDGVKFQGSGRTMTADDVKFSLSRIWSTPGAGDFKANGLQRPDQIKVIDPRTVRIDFETPDGKPTPPTPVLLAIFGQAYTSIVDKAAVEPHITGQDKSGATWLRQNAVGTGPYTLAQRTPGQSLTLKASPTSWMPQPAYPTVNVRISTAGVASLLQNNTINYADSGFTNTQIDNLQKTGKSVFWQETGFFDMFAITSGPAADVGPLGDKAVRQAIAYALPYDQVLKSIISGRGQRAKSIVADTAPEYTPAWEKYTTDLDKAKSLLAAAGNPKINVPLYYLQGDDDQTNTALLIQANLTKIGITTKLTPQTQAGLFDVVNARSQPATGTKIGPPGLELFNWTAWTDDPKIVIGYWATTGGINNYPLWASSKVDAANRQFALQSTSATRTTAYQESQRIIADEVPLVPLVTTGAVTVTSPGISGVTFAPTGSGRFWTLHPKGTVSKIISVVE